MKTDPVENTLKYRIIKRQLHRKIVAMIGEGGYMGYCHKYWSAKKLILRRDYGIEWHSPAELNPDAMFD